MFVLIENQRIVQMGYMEIRVTQSKKQEQKPTTKELKSR